MSTVSHETRLNWSRPGKVIGALGGMAILTTGLIMGCEYISSSNDPAADTYVSLYTADGECLSNTVYDPDRGAMTQEAIQGDDGTLTVRPAHADPLFGEGLQFTFHSPDGSDFHIADGTTRAILAQHHCG